MSNVDAILASLREALKEELRADNDFRAEILSELSAQLSGGARTQKPKTTKKAPKSAPVKAPKASALKVKDGARRTPEDLGKAKLQIWNWFRQNPGSRIDQLSAAINVPVKDLQLPVSLLLNEKGRGKAGLTKRGKLRGTTYTTRTSFARKGNGK